MKQNTTKLYQVFFLSTDDIVIKDKDTGAKLYQQYLMFTPGRHFKEFGDTNEVIRIRKSKKNRQRNGQKKKNKRTNNDL